jgi:hypothetical protein
MEKVDYDFCTDIEGDTYRQFIRWACGKSDVVMLAYRYTGMSESEDKEDYDYDRKLDEFRNLLCPYLVKDINSIGDYPSKYELDEDWAYTRETTPWEFRNVDFDRSVPLTKKYSWPGTGTTYLAFPDLNNRVPPDIYIQYYRITPEIMDVLLSANSFKQWNYPNRPEDPCFFKDGKCWFRSTCHEEMFTVIKGDAQDEKALDAMGIEYDVSEADEYLSFTMPED